MTSDQHMGNSTVLYCIVETDGSMQKICGQISQIFTMRCPKKNGLPGQTPLWFEVKQIKNLAPSDQTKHHFKAWPHL